MTVIGIDSSIRNPGFCLFENEKLVSEWTHHHKGTKDDPDLVGRIVAIGEDLSATLRDVKPDVVLVEWTENWTRPATSQKSVNVRELQKLAYATGGIVAICVQYVPIVHLIPQGDWKRRRCSKLIRYQMEAIYEQKMSSEHSSDAVGMVHWWLETKKLERMAHRP